MLKVVKVAVHLLLDILDGDNDDHIVVIAAAVGESLPAGSVGRPAYALRRALAAAAVWQS